MPFFFVAGDLLFDRVKIRQRGFRKFFSVQQAIVKIFESQIDSVGVFLLAESDFQRENVDADFLPFSD